MKKYIFLMLAVVLPGLFGACSKDDPFDNPTDGATGKFLTSSLDISLVNEEGPRSLRHKGVRAKAPAVEDFTVEFFKEGSDEAVAKYLYSDMPEIVTLPVGTYVARASYGNNPDAAFESPYYKGESNKFKIEQDKITDEVDPIKCRFANVCVTILFDDALKAAMGSDCKVTVNVGEQGMLEYMASDEDRPGYFAYVENSNTLAATFSGTIAGGKVSQTKAYGNVKEGSHYSITFRMYDAGEPLPGEVGDGTIDIDSSLILEEDLNIGLGSGEGNLDDDMRPEEGGNSGEEPGIPDEPNTPDNPSAGPTITAQEPISFDKVNEISEIVENGYEVKLFIHSDADGGVASFTVDIKSNTLSEQVLTEVGLSSHLDLGNPGSTESMLRELNFPVKDDVVGQHDVMFDITPFMEILQGVAQEPDTHSFTLTVRDADGKTTIKTIVFHNN